ncbi:hypothetical protein HPB50_005452 [Hyalomma asiaticum]|uniref:Uncharacterized protein n=1 Tax=Hyalomma asiaticum TaxID=266040 RepID=A0ACB7STK2_HYAAI|nr:hypothetical protein HPB50_005452 [Hyalomma asiaticum]
MATMFDHNRNSTGLKFPKKEWPREIDHSWDQALPVPKWAIHLGPWLVAGASLACFGHSLAGDFVFDDTEAVVHNVDIQPEIPLRRIFEDDFWGTELQSESSHKSYRPLTTLTFKLNCMLAGGLVASHFHAVNVILHALVSLLSLRLFRVLLQGAPRASLICALLFAVHPVHTESVAAVVGRADLLCAVFFILSFLSFIRSCSSEITLSSCVWLITSASLSIVSMLCKEPGITVIGLCFIYDAVIICKLDPHYIITRRSGLVQLKKQLFPAALRQGALSMVACTALAVRWKVMGSSSPVFQRIDNPASFEENFFVRVANYNHVYALNVWLLLCPQWLCFDWSMGCLSLIRSITDARIFSVVSLWLSLAVLVSRMVLAPDAQLRRSLCIALSLLVVPFLPASNLFFRVGFVVAERVLYLPSMGFCLLVVLGMARLVAVLPQHRQRCHEWRKESSLFESGLKVCPGNAKVHYNFAKNVGDSGDREGAIQGYREALRLHPDYDQAMNNLANILRDAGELQEAQALLQRAVQLRPDFAAAWMNLGIVQSSLGLLDDAEQSYRTAISHRAKYPDCYYNLGNLYLEQKRYEDAYRAWRNATRQRPTHLVSWNNLVLMLDQRGHASDAERAALQALRHLPHEPALHFQLANILGKAGKYQHSEQHFLAAIRFSPDNPSYHTNLVAKKIEVIQWHRENGRNVHQMSRHFKLDRKRIREWEKNFNNLLQQNYRKAKLRRKLSNGVPVFSEHVDDALFEFLERERSAGRAVSNRLLSEEAVKIANSMQLGNFVASSHYVNRWKQRFGVATRRTTNESQKTPEEFSEAASAFRSSANSLRRRHGYTLYNIANMDQTMVRIDNPANRTNNVIGESTIRIANTGCARRGFTVCLAARATGHKLPAFIIFKEKSGKIPARAFASLRIPGVLYHRWKKYDLAEERYRHALKLKPDLKSAHDNLNMLLQQTRLQTVETKH